MFSWFINWISNIKNKFLRKILELITGIDKKSNYHYIILKLLQIILKKIIIL